jgi:hypothetical protein
MQLELIGATVSGMGLAFISLLDVKTRSTGSRSNNSSKKAGGKGAGKMLTAAQVRAVRAFNEGSCMRVPSEDRIAEDGASYKKGWEIRFYARSEDEVGVLERALGRATLKPGRPYQKSAESWVVPLYGYEQVSRVLDWVKAAKRAK